MDTTHPIPSNRILHMQGVAEYMYQHADERQFARERMYILGLLHDIGYVFGDTNHELTGSSYMEFLGYKDSKFLMYHGFTPQEYMEFTGCPEDEIPQELILLWEADMMVDLTGQVVGYQRRCDDILARRGKQTYQRALTAAKWLSTRGHGYF